MTDSIIEELPAVQSFYYDLVFIDDLPRQLEVYFTQNVALTLVFPNKNLREKPKYEVSAPTYSARFKQALARRLGEVAEDEDQFSLFVCIKTAYDFLNDDESSQSPLETEVSPTTSVQENPEWVQEETRRRIKEAREKQNGRDGSEGYEIGHGQENEGSNEQEYEEEPYDYAEEFSRMKVKDKNKGQRIKAPEIFSGEPISDRKSTFQAHVAVIHSKDEAMAVLDKLKENNKIARATHNIYAWSTTIEKNGRSIKAHDCEDDGETGAGPKLANLIDLMKVDNLIVVVTRWYGGIHLGPDRFRHICNVARDVIEENISKK